MSNAWNAKHEKYLPIKTPFSILSPFGTINLLDMRNLNNASHLQLWGLQIRALHKKYMLWRGSEKAALYDSLLR